MNKAKKVILLILDGWGIGKPDKFNAIDNAKKPNFDRLVREYPNTLLRSDGPSVGLPEGQFGTSEINHQVIGAGRVVLQDLPKLNHGIESGEFYTNEILVNLCKRLTKRNKSLHLIGILSDGKVHSSVEHWKALIKLARDEGVKKLYLHIFTDGRDTPPRSASEYIIEIEKELHGFEQAKIATLQGRFYLDRDRDWSKTQKALDLICEGKGIEISSWQSIINLNYNNNLSDEFFTQYVLDTNAHINAGDSVIFTHYRTDRLYQIVKGLLDKNIKDLEVATFIEVSEELKTKVAFPRPQITHSLAQTISEAKKTQLHITETEKYTHLTYFLNCGKEKAFRGETWKLIESNRFVKPFYNFDPSMRNFEITEQITASIENNSYDFIIANYSSPDMVGHTGNYEAAVVSVESADYCLSKIFELVETRLDDYALLVTADHGNSDIMWDYEANQPHTQHTTNPVPLILISDLECKLQKHESLEDIAPTVLDLMQIAIPDVMTGKSLIREKS